MCAPMYDRVLTSVVVEDSRWVSADLRQIAHRAVQESLRHFALASEPLEVVILGCDDRRIAALNLAYRGRDGPTDVLSWPAYRYPPRADGMPPPLPVLPPPMGTHALLGDIAIAYDSCAADAARLGRVLAHHTGHLLIHAVLHLLGYDHQRSKDTARMQTLETTLLSKLGLPSPYAMSEGV